MPPNTLAEPINPIVAEIRACQERADWANAAALMAEYVFDLLDRLSTTELVALFAPFPTAQVELLPLLWYVGGLVYTRLERLDLAFVWLEKALENLGNQEPRSDRLILVYLELARLHYARDEFDRAQAYIDQAAALIGQGDGVTLAHEAFLNYMIACLCGDTGRVGEGIAYAEQAVQQYRRLHNQAREFRALLTLYSLVQQMGDHAAMLDTLNQAHACYESGRLESAAYEALLNAETHLAWWSGNLDEALSKARTWVQLSKGSAVHRRRLYAHWVMGNVLRALERYSQAFEYYEQARAIANERCPNFVCWIDAQEAWLAVLEGRLNEAEELIRRALAAADYGQTMSFQVNLGIIEMLTGRRREAERHLGEAHAYYTRSQDRQATCAISFHLAYLRITQGERTAAIIKLLRSELRWLEEIDNAYFPLWWHGGIVSRVAVFLLGVPEHHALARRFFRQGFLRSEGVRALRVAWTVATPAQRAEIAELLAGQGALLTASEATHADGDINQVIGDAIMNGVVQPSMVPQLFIALRTARQRNVDNPTSVAIFLLHLHGVTSGDIALRLAISRSSVSHALQIIYESLGVSRRQGSRIEQRSALLVAARAQGLIV